MPLRIALCQVTDVTDELAAFARQLGVTSVNVTFPAIPHEHGYWKVADLIALRERCESRGLTLEVIENFPHDLHQQIVLGLPGRDRALDGLSQTIQNLAAAGIPMLGYHFMPNGVWRTTMVNPIRGGALASAFDESLVHLGNRTGWPQPRNGWDGNPDHLIVTHAQMWENYEYFLKRILPVADSSGIKLAQHPDDPPVTQVDGVARIFTNPDAFARALELAGDSPSWGIDLCLGTVSEMDGAASVHEMIDRFGPAGRLRYVHFRDVQGSGSSFTECFLGEGNYSPSEVIDHLLRVGFDGWLQDDHVPLVSGDTPYGHRARGYEIGYMQGILATRAASYTRG